MEKIQVITNGNVNMKSVQETTAESMGVNTELNPEESPEKIKSQQLIKNELKQGDEVLAEITRCKEDPYYFYAHYYKVPDGMRELTREEFERAYKTMEVYGCRGRR